MFHFERRLNAGPDHYAALLQNVVFQQWQVITLGIL